MNYRSLVGAITLAALAMPLAGVGGVAAGEEMRYPPNWGGRWTRVVHREVEIQGAFDQTRPFGRGQQAPLTAEYQQAHKQSMDDQAAGGLGNYPTATCRPSGMPRMMTFGSQEYVITPEVTYLILSGSDHLRRIYTDGRDWPKTPVATYGGYTIGRWIDTDGDGAYDLLDTETRYFKGPRAFDASGLPTAIDNRSVFKEQFFVDKNDVMHILTTVIDNALTRPWTSDRQYLHAEKAVVQWPETWCQEGNANVIVGNENYFVRADGLLMPAKPNQTPPDLKYFKPSQK